MSTLTPAVNPAVISTRAPTVAPTVTGTRRDDFNVWGVESPSEHSGISRPRAGVFRDSPLAARYNSFDSERYILSLDDRAWREVAAAAPYDFVLMLVNSEKYGGRNPNETPAEAVGRKGSVQCHITTADDDYAFLYHPRIL